ncbi:MAG: hypothetical protein ACRD1T_15845, partial [Acidimicrobiia bacterium]
MRRAMLCLVLFLLQAVPATAAGINLSWDACTPEGGVQSKTSPCNSNFGNHTAWASFSLAANQPAFVGIEVIFDLQSESTQLPDWWQLFNEGSCRQLALSANALFLDAPGTSCTDPWQGQAQGGVGAYMTATSNPPLPSGQANAARIVVGFAMSSPRALVGGTEYYGLKLVISNTKTVGTGSCAGCATPVCVVLNEIRSAQNNGTDERLTSAIVRKSIR